MAAVDNTFYGYINIMGIYDTYSESCSNVSFIEGEDEGKVIFRSEVNSKHEKSKITASFTSRGDVEYQKIYLDQSEPSFKLTKSQGRCVITIDRISYVFYDGTDKKGVQYEQTNNGASTQVAVDVDDKDSITSLRVSNAEGVIDATISSNPLPVSSFKNIIVNTCGENQATKTACDIFDSTNDNRIAHTISKLMSTVYVPVIQNKLRDISVGLRSDKDKIFERKRA